MRKKRLGCGVNNSYDRARGALAMGQWHIPSNSGSDAIVFEFTSPVGASTETALWSVTATTLFGHRGEEAGQPLKEVVEHEVRIGQLLIERRKLEGLVGAFRKWLSVFEPILFEVTDTPGQQLSLVIGPDPMLISSARKPALIMTYRGIAVELRTFTVLDESCVRIAMEELELALTGPS